MKGIMEFYGSDHQFVGKKSEYPTKESFSAAVENDHGPGVFAPVQLIEDGWVRFYPKGTQEHPDSVKGEPFYMACEKAPGSFECWFVDYLTGQDAGASMTMELKSKSKR